MKNPSSYCLSFSNISFSFYLSWQRPGFPLKVSFHNFGKLSGLWYSICYKFQGQRKTISQQFVTSRGVPRLDSLQLLCQFCPVSYSKNWQAMSMSISKRECWEFWLNDHVAMGPYFPQIAIRAKTRPQLQANQPNLPSLKNLELGYFVEWSGR